jgi:hypothetical protein
MAVQAERPVSPPPPGSNPLDAPVRLMLISAMLIFIYTIVVGILNGVDLIDFEREILLAHLHGGTLGWMTLAILAVTLWLFATTGNVTSGSAAVARVLAVVAVVSIAAYVFAFATTFGIARPIIGTFTLAALVGFGVWAAVHARGTTLSVLHLFVLLGLAVSVLGGVFGVLNGLALARGWEWPQRLFDAHPGTMEIGFVIPVAMGIGEWGMRRQSIREAAPKWGKVQVALMFTGFAALLGAILVDVEALIGLAILPGVVGVVVFIVRMWNSMRTVSLLDRAGARHAVLGSLLVGVAMVYIFVTINMAGGDFDEMSRGQQLSFIHLLAVGGTTNALLAFVFFLSRRNTEPTVLDDVVFAGLNVGLIGFVFALTADIGQLIHLFAPILGISLLLAIALHVVGLWVSRDDAGPGAERDELPAGAVRE